MKKIGVLFGAENTFPSAVVNAIQQMELEDVTAEFVQVGGVSMVDPARYSVVLDRVSHDVPFYRAWLKSAALQGTYVASNPFWWSADDKFFNYALANRLGVAVPPTVLLPHKQLPPHVSAQSLRNLEFPLDWERIFAITGFPAYLKPHDGGGWRDVFYVRNEQEFFAAYDQTRDLCMVLQRAVEFQSYVRCFVVGRSEVRLMPYDPRQPHEHRYLPGTFHAEKRLRKRIERQAVLLCKALGYDMNTVEFAIADGVPYAIDFMNPVPDADLHSIGAEHFAWVVESVSRFLVRKARSVPLRPLARSTRPTALLRQARPPAR
ncbi:MAG: hypothetical protein KGK08_09040 [Acidobacteriota bacterium]|nr:hypothetical protein [Acidobacteriota bacterium]